MANTTLGGILGKNVGHTVVFEGIDPELCAVVAGKVDVETVVSSITAGLTSGFYATAEALGTTSSIHANLLAYVYQDEDAHDDCSLTACLNPLHPGPCKGWKGTLFKTAPGAFHSIEAAKAEKANTARLAKIADLKAKGLPIPKKLLTPIVPKAHPDAGKTANKASGEAHAAGKAVSDAAGVKTTTPGKVTLGQAIKTLSPPKPVEKGPKGKKPTLASKGIAHIIAQEKVTPQYKLDKASGITPEQWNDLPADDKATIRGELAKVQKDGFGPQQKKATELLDKLPEKGLGIGEGPNPKAPSPLKPAELNAAQKAAADAFGVHGHLKSPEKKLAALGALSGEEFKALPDKTQEDAKAWLKQLHKYNPELRKEVGAAMAKFTTGNAQAAWQKEADHPGYTPTMAAAGKHLLESGSLGKAKAGVQERFGTYKKLTPEEFHNLNGQEQAFVLHDLSAIGKGKDPKLDAKLANDLLIKLTAKNAPSESAAHEPGTKPGGAKVTKLSEIATPKTAVTTSKPKLTPTQQAMLDKVKAGEKLSNYAGQPGGVNLLSLQALYNKGLIGYDQDKGHYVPDPSQKMGVDKPKPSVTDMQAKIAKAAERSAEDQAKAKNRLVDTAAPTAKPKPLPAHVEAAIAMAKGHAPGASWSKNHLAAYQSLSAEDFHALPPDVQAKIATELGKAQTKFLDPKKIAAAKALLEKFQGKGVKAASKAAPENVTFQGNLHDHSVTKAQAKEIADQTPLASHFLAAKTLAGLTDADNPDAPQLKADVAKQVDQFIGSQTGPYEDGKILDQPDVKAAMALAASTMQDLKYAQAVHKAKTSAFNKINLKLSGGAPGLAPLEAASLEHYQKSLLGHPVKTDMATMDKLQHDAAAAIGDLHVKLLAAKKKANAPKAQDMSPVQLSDRIKELLGEDAAQPKANLSQAELKTALDAGKADAAAEAAKWPPEVLDNPDVKAKLGALAQAAGQMEATQASQKKLDEHLDKYHLATMTTGLDIAGNPLTADDEKAIELHQKQILVNHKYLKTAEDAGQQKLLTAKVGLHLSADNAKQNLKPAEPIKLSTFDQATIPQVYSDTWFKHADKAVTYGVKTYTQAQQMKAHPDFLSLKQDLADLKTLSGELALASAVKHTAKLNVPTDEDGAMIDGPERKAWLAAVVHQSQVAKQFETLHKTAQGKLDKIRIDAGLKKRALPKADAPAVKAGAAESGYHKSGSYGGPNYGKPTAAKNYMLAKVGPQHAVVHLSPTEKKAEKLGAAKAPSTAKIENEPGGEPVKLGGGDSSIAHIPAPLKKQITNDFKAMPNGKYLADPTEDIFANLVTLAAAHGKTVPDGLSIDQVLKTIDETHSKSLGVSNSGMLHKKITDWLGTAAGKQYAESHSTPDAKMVKHLSGELDLPKGVALAPGEKVQKLAGPGPHDESLAPSAFKAARSPEAQAAQDDYMKASGSKWTPQQKAALKSYTGSAYSTYNGYLRGEGSASTKIKQDVIDIQSAMLPLQHHTLLKRGTGWGALPAEFQGANASKMIGKTFQEPGFVSTTVAGESGHFSGPLQLEIEAPVGTPAAFVNGISHFKNKENEMLLAAGTKFKVISVTKKGGQTVMRVRIVGDK